jgi:hypothetical protein
MWLQRVAHKFTSPRFCILMNENEMQLPSELQHAGQGCGSHESRRLSNPATTFMKTIYLCLLLFNAAFLDMQVHAENLTLSGIVTDQMSRLPVAQANVSLVGGLAAHDVFTDAKGQFILTLVKDIRNGAIVRVRVRKDGYVIYDQQVPVAKELPLLITLVPQTGIVEAQSQRLPKKGKGDQGASSTANSGTIVQQGRNNIIQGSGSTAIIEENPSRAFDRVQEEKFLGSIKNANITPMAVFILAVSNDGDVDKLARQIETALESAHWPVTYYRYGTIVDARNPYHADGIRCVSDRSNFMVEATAQALKNAPKVAGEPCIADDHYFDEYQVKIGKPTVVIGDRVIADRQMK